MKDKLKDGGGPAYPNLGDGAPWDGMSLRERVALEVLGAMLTGQGSTPLELQPNVEDVVGWSFEYANEFLRQRERL